MAGVFISYRREDSPGHAGRIFDRVRARFGADVVFMDVTAIDAGVDFVDAIDRAVGTCDVLLAVIGPHWAGATDSAGRKRLDNPNDFIRLEIGGALKRNVRVVPVLVDDAQLPASGELPDDLQPLLRRNAVELRDARWDADIEQLVASLERIVKPPEAPLRLEAPPRGGWRWVAAVAVLGLGVGAAAVLWPRESAPPARSVATTGPAATAPTTTAPTTTATPPARPSASSATPVVPSPSRATPPAPRAEPAPKESAPKEPPPIPDVVGHQLSEAREILRRAGVEVARVLYRDDRAQTEDLVVMQADAKVSAGSPRAVVLTAVARAAVVIHHRPEDSMLARRLAGALAASGATSGLAVRLFEVQPMKPEGIARVFYKDPGLAGTAGTIAKDASAWLAENDPGRSALLAGFQSSVVSRSIVIGLPERGLEKSAPSALPDVRGLGLADARRMLTAAGVKGFAYKWADDPTKKALEVFGQSESKSRTGERMVVLMVYARGTLWLYRTDKSSPLADRFARELQSEHLNTYGIVLRIVRQSAVRPELLGKVETRDPTLAREARSIAAFASNWLGKELGRPNSVDSFTGTGGDPRRLTFGLPALE
jgi:hypothetical protein